MTEQFWRSARFSKIWDSPLASIHRLKYFADQPCSSGREVFSGNAFFFYKQGYFELKLQNKSHLIDPTSLVFNQNGDEWVVDLPAKTEICCTEIFLKEPIVQGLIDEMCVRGLPVADEKNLSLRQSRVRTSSEINRFHAQLLSEVERKDLGSNLLVESIATTMCILSLRQFLPSLRPDPYSEIHTSEDHEIEKIERAKALLSAQLRDEISLHELSCHLNISPFHLIRIFKRLTGQTPHQYLTNLKVKTAKDLLLETSDGIAEIAFQLGYSNPSHFSAIFKKNVGETPQVFRKEIREKPH
ncbi:helix-turn-helix transcriptional regulator [Candidatus Acetothermia bacterium]|nr:helix-turn-helix transcriptional regulator [Candidatus Acetothermia bacterium]MBI3643486.1 helix-turn-helix transcriptional regulator [Candidatus Acetothermia bacterium]